MAKGEHSFGTVENRQEIRELGRFVATNYGGYDIARHKEWTYDICMPAVASGDRIGYGFWLRDELQGAMVLKTLVEDDHDTADAELKFFRVAAPTFEGRGTGGFMMHQVPAYAQQLLEQRGALASDASTFTIQLDTRADSPAQSFFERFGFQVMDTVPLYDIHIADVVMQRTYELR